jgi:hypothetical protein
MSPGRLVTVHEPERLAIDGEVADQRADVAQIVGELYDEARRINDAADEAKSILRSMMLLNQPKPILSVRTPMYVVRLRKLLEARCALHTCPPYACFRDHANATVTIVEMELGRAFSIQRLDDHYDESKVPND